MITVTGFKQKETKDGRQMMLLEITGDLTFAQSSTGKWYATTPKCAIPSSFDEATAKRLVGTRMEGSIARVATEPYTIVDEQSGEEIELAFRWSYVPPGSMAPVMEMVS